MARAMCTLVMNREHVARLGMAARHHVCRNYSWEKRGPTLAGLYSQIAESRRDTTVPDDHVQPTSSPAA